MAEKLLFSLKVFTLGFSVVMIVLFALYGLTALFNRLALTDSKNKEKDIFPKNADDGSPAQLAAAIAAAVSCHRETRAGSALHTGSDPGPLQEIGLPEIGGSLWRAAGRKELAGKSAQAYLSRRKKS